MKVYLNDLQKLPPEEQFRVIEDLAKDTQPAATPKRVAATKTRARDVMPKRDRLRAAS
jgi:hypothetical protein